MTTVPLAAGPARRLPGRALGRWGRSPDLGPVAFLAALPVLVFAIPAMTGHPAISYDNLIQNFPLRVLAGQLFSSGHLPLWNPTIWSGSPLLAGLNAGSFYPGTLLFAIFPGVLAWVFNLIGVYWAAGIGTYALLRQYSLRPTACLLAAVTYQFGGAMTGQLVHLGIVQGLAWMPLIVLAEVRLSWAVLGTGPSTVDGSRLGGRSSPWPWVTLLGTLVGLIFLTGEPRSMAEAELVAPFVLAWLALRPYRGEGVDLARRARYVAGAALAAAWGLAIGAAQLLPGRTFILASQRAHESYAFFGLGSLRPSWSILLLVQNLFGGNTILGQPAFSIGYNLPEVTGYVGLLPLAAFAVLLVRSIGRRSDPRAPDWRPWLVLAPIGLLLSWGAFTPLGHLFAQIPFYNEVRLDSRSLGIVDLALAIGFGFWLELFLAGEWRERLAGPGRWWREVAAPMVFPVAGFLAAAVMVAIPATVLVALGAVPSDAPGRRVWMAAQAVVALGAIAVLWAWRRGSPDRARRLLVAVVAADLGLFALTCSTGMFAGGQPEPTRAEAAPIVGNVGRFAIIAVPSITQLSAISEPDINGLTGLDSVQGYGSIVSGEYDRVTGAHFIASMDPCALARGAFVQLRLRTLFVLPHALSRPLQPGAEPKAPASCAGGAAISPNVSMSLYLGQTLDLVSVRLTGALVCAGMVCPSPFLRTGPVGVISASGSVRYPAQRVVRLGALETVKFDRPQQGAGIVAPVPVLETSTVTTTEGSRYAFTGLFQQALSQSTWRLTGSWNGYERFRTEGLAPRVYVSGAPVWKAHQVSTTRWGTEVDEVSTPVAATVVRSEAYLPGWKVTARPVGGGPSRVLPVIRVGLVQGVKVPAGHWMLTFKYWPSGLTLGGIASALGVVAVLVMTAVRLRRRVARRPAAGDGK
ncbi:MAG: hypothetical protein ACRDYB_05430 [Acidimicrobiales bacterium]